MECLAVLPAPASPAPCSRLGIDAFADRLTLLRLNRASEVPIHHVCLHLHCPCPVPIQAAQLSNDLLRPISLSAHCTHTLTRANQQCAVEQAGLGP
ncbi:hypothetical protein DUNSADRAFT_11930 [Dunaliella salina]|uniref:Encoded protein n=1 Tax=Dunaliella salina TaxID=3046 RepID=A0ABQ7GCG7_DUNSA|nr:hypothetical protein DUNSADRAFT_11930 [Dunaliella salina]|eukprot:KAF5832258.1 hypothetical protein DUNSADRAFT_11930 [Dunaliella salina]